MRKKFLIEIEVNDTIKRTHAELAQLLEYFLRHSEIPYTNAISLLSAKVMRKDPEKKEEK